VSLSLSYFVFAFKHSPFQGVRITLLAGVKKGVRAVAESGKSKLRHLWKTWFRFQTGEGSREKLKGTSNLLAIVTIALALSCLSLRSHFSTATTAFRSFTKLSFHRPALALALWSLREQLQWNYTLPFCSTPGNVLK